MRNKQSACFKLIIMIVPKQTKMICHFVELVAIATQAVPSYIVTQFTK